MTFDDTPGSQELFLFLAATAHDMKNSLSVVSGTLESLLADGSPSAAGHPQLAHMLYQTKRLNDNLIQLLALYKQVGKPEYPFDMQPLEVGHLVSQVVSASGVLLKSRGIALETDFDPQLIWHFDEDLLIGVLGNAINNAIHYTRDKIRLAIATVDGCLEVRVEDNGAGYPAAMLEAGASAMSGVSSGVNFLTNSTGLGLYFSSEVAKMHKHRQRSGALRLENGGAYGGGCFVLTCHEHAFAVRRGRRGQHRQCRLGRKELPGGGRLHRHPPAAARKPAQPGRQEHRPGLERRRGDRDAVAHPLRRGAVRLQPGRRQERPAGAGRSAHAQPAAAEQRVDDGVGRKERRVGDGRGRAPAGRLPDQADHRRRAADPAEPGVAQEAGVQDDRPGLRREGLPARGQAVRRADRGRQGAPHRAAAHEGEPDDQERRAGEGARSLRAGAGRARIPVGARRAWPRSAWPTANTSRRARCSRA